MPSAGSPGPDPSIPHAEHDMTIRHRRRPIIHRLAPLAPARATRAAGPAAPAAPARVAAALAVAAAILAPATPAPAEDLPVEPRFAAVDAWLAGNPGFFPEGVGLVLVEDGAVVFRRTYHGLAFDDVLPIASSTKWISGLAITAAIVDPSTGLTPETRISEHVPAFGPPFSPDKETITLGQAFAHLSALPAGAPNPHRNPLLTHEQAVAAISALELEGDPGGQIRYDGKAMSAAGLAVAAALGTDWTSHAEAVLFGPLGMDATDWDAFTPPELVPTANPNVAGSIRTSMRDYERFLVMLGSGGTVDGTEIVRPAAIRLLLEDRAGVETPIERSPYATYAPFVPDVAAFRTGFGCFIDPARIVPDVAAGEPAARWATSAGAFGTNAFLDLDRGLAGVLFTENQDRWPNPDPDLPPYNPSTRAFLQFLRPLIEAAVPVVCPTDVDRNDRTGFADLVRVLGAWNATTGPEDVNGDGLVGFDDVVAVLGAWGPCA